MYRSEYSDSIKSLFIALFSTAIVASCSTSSQDSVKIAEIANNSGANWVSPAKTRFLVEMADARMAGYEEGKIAAERGETPQVREYGKTMMLDQKILLAEIEDLALANDVILPQGLSDSKKNGLNDLQKMSGKNLDRKFASMIRSDHERDVRAFKKAGLGVTYTGDQGVYEFANERLVMIEDHLTKAIELEKQIK